MRVKAIGLAFLTAAFAASAAAQTAHLSGVQSIVATNNAGISSGVAVDASGNVYFAELGLNLVVKEVPTPGGYTASTIGSGLSSPRGVAVDGSGNVYIADSANDRVLKETLSASGYTQTVLADASTNGLIQPWGIAADGNGNVYITDFTDLYGKSRVLVETPSAGSYIQSVLPTSGLLEPTGVAVDASGNIYIANAESVVKETPSAGSYIESVVVGGFATPIGVAVDGSGNVYVLGTYNVDEVLKETPSAGGYAQSIVETGATLLAGYPPQGIAVDSSGDVYVSGGYEVTKLWATTPDFGPVNIATPNTNYLYVAFTFDTGGTIGAPVVLTQGAKNLDFTDARAGTCTTNGTSHTYKSGDICTVAVAFNPTRPGTRYGAVELQDNSGNVLATGYMQGTGVGPQVNFLPGVPSRVVSASALFPYCVAVDGSGNVFIAEPVNQRVMKETLTAGGYSESTLGSGLNLPVGVAVDGSGSVYIADGNNDRVLKETWSGSGYTQSIVGPVGQFNPWAIAVDGGGNIYVTDLPDNQAFKLTLSAGSYTLSTVPTGGLRGAQGIAVDSSGNIYIADTGDNLVLKELWSGNNYIPTQPIGSDLYWPTGVALDGEGDVYIVDEGNDRILKETPPGPLYIQSVVTASNSVLVPEIDNPFTGLASDGSGNLYLAAPSGVEKLDLVDAPSLTFASTPIGTTSGDSPQTVTVENAGNATLTFPVPAAGSNPSIAPNFTRETTDCPVVSSTSTTEGSLAAGASCELPIGFTPVSVGSLSGSLVLTDDNLNISATQSIALSGTSTQGTPTVSLASSVVSVVPTSNTSVFLSTSVTFTATVFSSAGAPTGSITFWDQGTLLATVPLNGNAAAYTTSGLAAGIHPIIAEYSGDANFLNASSPLLNMTVVDFTVALSSASGVSGSLSASPGGQVAYPLVITPVGGSALPGAVSLSVTGLPAGATAVFAPATVTAGSGTTNITLLVTLPARSAAANPVERPFGGGPLPVGLGLLLLPFAGRFRKGARNWNRIVRLLLLGLAGTALAVGVTGCGGSSGPYPQIYTLTVTGSAGSLSHSTAVNLTVE